MITSFPLSIRQVKATESRLQAIFDAAKLGLRGDSLALAAGMLPAEYRQLCILDPVAEYAEQAGRAKGEAALSKVMHEAAYNGDTKAALAVLQNRHDWVAKQQVQVDVTQQISILTALEQAQQRLTIDADDAIFSTGRNAVNEQTLVAHDQR
jgi:hypothetical protein